MVDKNIQFAGQFHGFRATTLGDRIISFRVDELYADSVKELVSTRIGTEFVITLVNVTDETNLNDGSVNRTIQERFYKKLHVLLNDYAVIKEIEPEEAKEELKKELAKRGMIEKSTKELDVKGLAVANNIVEQWIEKHGNN